MLCGESAYCVVSSVFDPHPVWLSPWFHFPLPSGCREGGTCLLQWHCSCWLKLVITLWERWRRISQVKTCLRQRWNSLGNSLFVRHWMGTKAVGGVEWNLRVLRGAENTAVVHRHKPLSEMQTHALLEAMLFSFCQTYTEGSTCCLLNNANSAVVNLFRF